MYFRAINAKIHLPINRIWNTYLYLRDVIYLNFFESLINVSDDVIKEKSWQAKFHTFNKLIRNKTFSLFKYTQFRSEMFLKLNY